MEGEETVDDIQEIGGDTECTEGDDIISATL